MIFVCEMIGLDQLSRQLPSIFGGLSLEAHLPPLLGQNKRQKAPVLCLKRPSKKTKVLVFSNQKHAIENSVSVADSLVDESGAFVDHANFLIDSSDQEHWNAVLSTSLELDNPITMHWLSDKSVEDNQVLLGFLPNQSLLVTQQDFESERIIKNDDNNDVKLGKDMLLYKVTKTEPSALGHVNVYQSALVSIKAPYWDSPGFLTSTSTLEATHAWLCHMHSAMEHYYTIEKTKYSEDWSVSYRVLLLRFRDLLADRTNSLWQELRVLDANSDNVQKLQWQAESIEDLVHEHLTRDTRLAAIRRLRALAGEVWKLAAVKTDPYCEKQTYEVDKLRIARTSLGSTPDRFPLDLLVLYGNRSKAWLEAIQDAASSFSVDIKYSAAEQRFKNGVFWGDTAVFPCDGPSFAENRPDPKKTLVFTDDPASLFAHTDGGRDAWWENVPCDVLLYVPLEPDTFAYLIHDLPRIAPSEHRDHRLYTKLGGTKSSQETTTWLDILKTSAGEQFLVQWCEDVLTMAFAAARSLLQIELEVCVEHLPGGVGLSGQIIVETIARVWASHKNDYGVDKLVVRCAEELLAGLQIFRQYPATIVWTPLDSQRTSPLCLYVADMIAGAHKYGCLELAVSAANLPEPLDLGEAFKRVLMV